MSVIGFLTGSLIPHLVANIIPSMSYLAGTFKPFIAAHFDAVFIPMIIIRIIRILIMVIRMLLHGYQMKV